ncbi:MAG: glycosyltransferase family 39 protein [Ignavibacteriales bacterium]|nr:glycosyltransferase family 39 protein [Ignavibacteriales bacterium]
MKINRQLFWIIILALILRLLFLVFYVDLENVNRWEYGEVAKNIINGNGYSLFYIDGNKLEYLYSESVKPYPSAYMPPGYVYTILPFFLIENEIITNIAIILFQIFLSLMIVVFLYKLVLEIFDNRTALIAVLIYAILPEFIFSVSSITPTIIFHLLITIILLRLYIQEKSKNTGYFIPILIALLIYFRVEFFVYLFILMFYFLIKKKFKIIFIYSTIIFILVLPWVIRNFIIFDNLIPLTTSSGLNLYRGNNSIMIGSWGDENIHAEILSLPRNDKFEVYFNKLYSDKAISYIKSNPIEFAKNIFIKNFELWIFNQKDSRATNILYIVPWLIILLFSIIGFTKKNSSQKLKYIIFVFVYFAVVSSIFFALPRYQTMMKIVMVPIAATGLLLSYEKIKIKFYK